MGDALTWWPLRFARVTKLVPTDDRREGWSVGWAKRSVPTSSLTKGSLNILHVSAPIGCQQPAFDESVKAAVGPVCNAPDVSVLYRVEVDIIDMALEVGVVANCMLPITSLPYAFFAL